MYRYYLYVENDGVSKNGANIDMFGALGEAQSELQFNYLL